MSATRADSNRVTEIPEFRDVLSDVFERIELRGQHGLETGFIGLDDMLNGLQQAELIVIGSRPSIGKTSLATSIVEHVSVQSKIPAAVFTLEMTKEQFAQRLICGRAHIDHHQLRRGLLTSHEYARLANVIGEAAASPLFVSSLPSVSLDEISDLITLAVQRHNVQVVAIDYVQLIEADADNRTEQLTAISRRLKALAMALNVPIICLSQLNRSPTRSIDHRPQLSDLRGSGTLEDEADVVLLLHRDDYYRMDEPDFQPDNIAEVIVAKQRNGPTGTVKLTFLNKSTRFTNLSMQADPF